MNRLFAIANRHFKPLLALNLLLLAGLIYAIHTRPTSWQANAKLIVPSTSGSLDVNLGKLGQLRGAELEVSPQLNPLSLLSSVLLSDDTLTALWQQDAERDRFQTVEDYSKLFKVSQQDGTTILSLEVGGDEPKVAEERLNQLISLFGDRLTQLRKGESTERSAFTGEELVTAQARLQSAQNELTAFQESSGLVSSETQTRTLVETLSQLRNRYTELTAARLSSQTQVETFQERLALTPSEAVQSLALGDDETYRFLRGEIVRLDAQIAEMRSLFQDDHPEVLLLKSERAKLQQQAAAQRTNTVGTTSISSGAGPRAGELMQQFLLSETTAKAQDQEAQALRQQIQRLEQQVQALPQKQAQLAELQRAYEIAEGVYNGLVAKGAESSLSAFNAYPSVQILDQPNVSAQPIGPKLSLMILGALFAAGFSSTALVLLLESRNPLLSPADVFAVDLRVLGTVPWLSQPAQQLQGDEPPALAFQRLASGITSMELRRRRLLISSATSSEGKTTATIGLGRALAALGFRVLLVDGDFAQAGLTQRLKCKAGALSNTTEILGAPVAVAPNLDLMPTAPGQSRRAMEFVARGDFNTTLALAERAGHYDYLLVDSAPVELTSETPIMGAATENVLLVTRAGFSERDQVYRALDEFSRHRVTLLGLLINEAAQSSQPKATPKVTKAYRQGRRSRAG